MSVSTPSTACWSSDARSTSAPLDPGRGRGECASDPDPCNTVTGAADEDLTNESWGHHLDRPRFNCCGQLALEQAMQRWPAWAASSAQAERDMGHSHHTAGGPGLRDLPCSTSRSTASWEAATWSACGSLTSPWAGEFAPE